MPAAVEAPSTLTAAAEPAAAAATITSTETPAETATTAESAPEASGSGLLGGSFGQFADICFDVESDAVISHRSRSSASDQRYGGNGF